MRLRGSTIEHAYPSTYERIFQPSHSQFKDWLQNGDGIFWLHGKTGSGKSTVMKFLSEHRKTKKILRAWAGEHRRLLLILDFYFWYARSRMEKSVQGLLQSMLDQMLSAYPEMVRVVCSRRWDEIDALDDDYNDPWREDELYVAMCHVSESSRAKQEYTSRETSAYPKFCFFIDGLDEYDGDQVQPAEFVKELALQPEFKVCASSPPCNVVHAAFNGSSMSLRLEDLTRSDI